MLYILKAVGSRMSNITLGVVNWSTFVWSTRPGQKRTDQDREEFNLADLILELAFLFVWDFFAQGNLVFTGKFRGKEIESFFRSGRFLGKLKRGRNACRWSTAPPSLLLRPVVPQFKPTTTDLQCRCSPICNYICTWSTSCVPILPKSVTYQTNKCQIVPRAWTSHYWYTLPQGEKLWRGISQNIAMENLTKHLIALEKKWSLCQKGSNWKLKKWKASKRASVAPAKPSFVIAFLLEVWHQSRFKPLQTPE